MNQVEGSGTADKYLISRLSVGLAIGVCPFGPGHAFFRPHLAVTPLRFAHPLFFRRHHAG
jgi:hypothetical protein